MDVHLSREEKLRGTAGGVKGLEGNFGSEKRFPYSPGAKRPTLAGTVIIRYC